MNRVLTFLCMVGVHHVPEERRRWSTKGWTGTCTRCAGEVFSPAQASR